MKVHADPKFLRFYTEGTDRTPYTYGLLWSHVVLKKVWTSVRWIYFEG
jgi:hypothetical protein